MTQQSIVSLGNDPLIGSGDVSPNGFNVSKFSDCMTDFVMYIAYDRRLHIRFDWGYIFWLQPFQPEWI
jgi:hypothetical protein